MTRQTTMSEEDWLGRRNPEDALDGLLADLDERRLRLFACACCRGVLGLLDDPRAAAAVGAAERYADGEAGPDVVAAMRGPPSSPQRNVAASWAAEALTTLAAGWLSASARNLVEVADRAARALRDAAGEMTWRAARRRQVGYLCDLRGRLFHTVKFDPAWKRWKEGLVVVMARAIYDEHRYAELPILADALEEAGCEERPILAHCRSPREHVRGCWAVDLLLGKE